MDFPAALSVAQTLFAALQCTQLREVWSIRGYKSEIEGLIKTVDTIKAVLRDAETKQGDLSELELHYVEELRDALYDADDLIDEFITLVNQKKQIKRNKFSKKVRAFFFRNNPVGFAHRMSNGVKKVMKKLDSIASNHAKFGLLKLDHKPIRKRREETCSYVSAIDIIGRDEDVNKILAKLLDFDNQRDVSFLTIVGMGGLGKTALAQLVYNDPRIANEFPLRIWTCVSDQDQNQFNVPAILGQILQSTTSNSNHGGQSMELLQRRVREQLAGERFLLVLDDVWTENRIEWLKLVRYLTGGQRGSWVVVTSRSQVTANIVGSTCTHQLQGLSDEHSLGLFQLVAFADSHTQHEFTDIGKEIVKKCANVPLAIRVVGSLLYGQEKSKWLSVKEFQWKNWRETQKGITDVLKFSYHNLESALKSCFSYCALFPKDSRMYKKALIDLWMAQGYVVPFEEGQSLEEAAEDYFLTLVRRCFLQDVEKNDLGEIESCKMHDFMHDVALQVTEKEIISAGNRYVPQEMNKIRHVSFFRNDYPKSFAEARIRSYLHLDNCCIENVKGCIGSLLASYKCLRSLNLSYFDLESIPESIGELLHLRYLNLSFNPGLELLPKSITKLFNLQTLDLDRCYSLKELPKDFSRLINLHTLNISCCHCLTGISSHMGNLTSLCHLTQFEVAKGNPREQHMQLDCLRALKNLRGSIQIVIHFPQKGAYVCDSEGREAAYMSNKEHLHSIKFTCCEHEESDEESDDGYEEELLGDLQPHPNLKHLHLWEYKGVRMPRWAREDNLAIFLPALVTLYVDRCRNLQSLLSLAKLHNLKYLHMIGLLNLEYIEEQPISGEEGLSFLSSLEELTLYKLPKLKGWWRRIGIDDQMCHTPSLSQLRSVSISDCPQLMSLPHCPNVEELKLRSFNERLQIMVENSSRHEGIGQVSSYCSRLIKVSVDNLAWLHSSLPVESLQCLTTLRLYKDMGVESLSHHEQVFRACSSSLQSLEIVLCPKLKSVSEVLKSLAVLETLTLSSFTDASLEDDRETDRLPWGSLHHSLKHLSIKDCKHLPSLPKWMQNLTSLQRLDIHGCSEVLEQRSQKPNGEDWPIIQHIPNIHISTEW